MVQATGELVRALQRDSEPTPPGRFRTTILTLSGGVGLALLAAWFFITPQAETAEPASRQPLSKPPERIPTPDASSRVLLQANGYITARQAATVSARTTAIVHEVYAEEGSFVRRGTVLARLDDARARAEHALAVSRHREAQTLVREAQEHLAAAQRRLSRTSELRTAELASVAELDAATTHAQTRAAQLEKANAQVVTALRNIQVHEVALKDYVVRAPFDGVVTRRSAQIGEVVSPISAGGSFTRSGIATLVNMETLELEVDVSENYISRIQANHRVEVELAAYPNRTYGGQVLRIVPQGDRNKGTIRVRIALTDRDERVLPDMAARVDFIAAMKPAA